MKPLIEYDYEDSDGSWVRLGCWECREDTRFRYTMAWPVRMYDVALECEQCQMQYLRWRS